MSYEIDYDNHLISQFSIFNQIIKYKTIAFNYDFV